MKTIIDFANKVRSLADGRISNIANVEESPSTHAYAVGKQLIFNGLLCNATSAIAVGDTLAVGTNLALSDNVVEQIYSLNQGLSNSLANISHENLLYNPWFTVNQRGVSSFGGDTSRHYGPDRWQIAYNPSSNTINVTSDGLQIAPTTSSIILWQKWDEGDFKELIGKCITTSVMTNDGTIYSGSAIFPQKGSSDVVSIRLADTDNTFNAYYQYNNNSGNVPAFGIDVKPGKSVTIKAVKLELGSVSTLAMDTAPNYATELLKCQRYFYRYKAAHTGFYFGLAIAWNTNKMSMVLPVPCMRITATITPSDFSDFLASKGASSVSPHNITNFENLGQSEQNHTSGLLITTSESDLTSGDIYVLKAVNSSAYIDFSADL